MARHPGPSVLRWFGNPTYVPLAKHTAILFAGRLGLPIDFDPLFCDGPDLRSYGERSLYCDLALGKGCGEDASEAEVGFAVVDGVFAAAD